MSIALGRTSPCLHAYLNEFTVCRNQRQITTHTVLGYVVDILLRCLDLGGGVRTVLPGSRVSMFESRTYKLFSSRLLELFVRC